MYNELYKGLAKLHAELQRSSGAIIEGVCDMSMKIFTFKVYGLLGFFDCLYYVDYINLAIPRRYQLCVIYQSSQAILDLSSASV